MPDVSGICGTSILKGKIINGPFFKNQYRVHAPCGPDHRQNEPGYCIAFEHGFTSGMMLEYIYRNQPEGSFLVGKLIDRIYLSHEGWRSLHGSLFFWEGFTSVFWIRMLLRSFWVFPFFKLSLRMGLQTPTDSNRFSRFTNMSLA